MITVIEILKDLISETLAVFTSPPLLTTYHYLLITSPIWLPVALGFTFWFIWIDYIRSKFILDQNYILLELKLPPEVFKSPLAMETILSNLHITTGASTWYDAYILGKVRNSYSFEIVSIEGSIHFFIWTRGYLKNLVESQFYAHYPNIEIFEVSDYTDYAPYWDKNKISLWAHHLKLTKPDPYPIKTYVDYGLDKDPKEEFKIDPLVSLLEYFSTLGKGEQAWMQILVQSHRKKRVGGSFKETDWVTEGSELIKKLQKEFRNPDKEDEKNKDNRPLLRFPTKAETDLLAALDRSISKLGYDVGVRIIYLAEKDKFVRSRVASVLNLMKVFNSNNLNGFALYNLTDFDYPFEDFMQLRANHRRSMYLSAYRRRAYFHEPYKMKPFVLNTEELATIFHLPGGVLQTPSVNRVSSRKTEAPPNLPH